MDLTPFFIREEANNTLRSLKSKLRYLKSYENFMKWRTENEVTTFSENDLLIYFAELAKNYKPSTLWSVYSMLKTTLCANHDVHLKDFERLGSFIKGQSKGFKSKKSKMLSSQEIETFITQAPDDIYLVMKVVLIMGVSGACRSMELVNMRVDDIKKQGDILMVTLHCTKVERTFLVKKEFVNIVEKYLNLRPSDMETNRFFVNYHKGKCFRQVIGKNKIAEVPKKIASYLNLPNPDLYSGHCFRRTSASLITDYGAHFTSLKQKMRYDDERKLTEVFLEVPVENDTDSDID